VWKGWAVFEMGHVLMDGAEVVNGLELRGRVVGRIKWIVQI
jgi:hypothetical protein